MFKILIIFFILSLATIACAQNKTIDKKTNIQSKVEEKFKVTKTEEEWKKILSPEAYYILREHGTERAFTGKYHAHHEKGIYYCAACDLPLFKSETKFDSGTGWPSFINLLKMELVLLSIKVFLQSELRFTVQDVEVT